MDIGQIERLDVVLLMTVLDLIFGILKMPWDVALSDKNQLGTTVVLDNHRHGFIYPFDLCGRGLNFSQLKPLAVQFDLLIFTTNEYNRSIWSKFRQISGKVNTLSPRRIVFCWYIFVWSRLRKCLPLSVWVVQVTSCDYRALNDQFSNQTQGHQLVCIFGIHNYHPTSDREAKIERINRRMQGWR